jgi:hypothetical protein
VVESTWKVLLGCDNQQQEDHEDIHYSDDGCTWMGDDVLMMIP